MKTKYGSVTVLAWLQLVVSVLLAAAIIWGYFTYHSSLGQIVRSIAASIEAVSNVVKTTAKTVDAQRMLLTQSTQMLIETGKFISEFHAVADQLDKRRPQVVELLRTTANKMGTISSSLQAVGNGMNISVPGIRLEGVKPIITTTRPLEALGEKVKGIANELSGFADKVSSVSASLGSDGKLLNGTLAATSQQALRVVSEAEKTLTRFNTQDLPKALEELNTTANNLKIVSTQVDLVSNISEFLLIVGLMFALWCFLSSLGVLMLVKSQASSLKEA